MIFAILQRSGKGPRPFCPASRPPLPPQLQHLTGEVERYVQEGRIGEVAAYCETDVVNTYRVWLVHELFRGALTKTEFEASEANVLEFLRERITTKPHLELLLTGPPVSPFPAQEPSEIHLPRAIWPVQ
ncbi:MAG: 3-5 exonuclease [Microvirga sp.]|jgi:hypothetical protein|nr:3-5 exonuclease [Microvirga sp.]